MKAERKEITKEEYVQYTASILSWCDIKFVKFIYNLVYNHHYKKAQ